MDMIGVIKRIFRSYEVLFSDDFIAFFKENSQNHVSRFKISPISNIDFPRKIVKI